MELNKRLETIWSRIEEAALRSGRKREDVTLIAVSKTFPTSDISGLAALGQIHFGENKVQELNSKRAELGLGTPENPIQWHFIGHLQRNKAKDIIGRTTLFHALESERLARVLQQRLSDMDIVLDVLIQVNVSNEKSKYGLEPGELDRFMDEVQKHENIRIRGLMTMARPVVIADEVRNEFLQLRKSLESVSDRLDESTIPFLSMGMSSDYEVAIEEGSTHVRIGSALFGKRKNSIA